MIVIMQARLGSTRLPGKAFFTFFGKNMVERSIAIAQSIDGVDRIILATGDRPENLALQSITENAGAEFFVGSEENVLERFIHAMDGYTGEHCLRMTCDNYLIQPEIIEAARDITIKKNADYTYISPLSHFGGEIIRCSTLRDSYLKGYSDLSREHVTWDIRTNNKNVQALPDNFLAIDHKHRLTLDTLNDLLTMKALERMYPGLEDTRCLDTIKKVNSEAS